MRQQRGVALIAVMMVVALVVVIAVGMSGRLQLQLQRQMNLQDRQQALWLALGAEEFTRRLLKRSAVGKDNVNLSQNWAQQGTTFPVDQGSITGSITDLQACFNLNALQKPQQEAGGSSGRGDTNPSTTEPTASRAENSADSSTESATESSTERTTATPETIDPRTGQAMLPAQLAFQRLLEQSVPELSLPAEYVVFRLTDWLDEDNLLQNAGGAEENDYAGLEFPYYTANSLLVSKSELRTLLDVTAADYAMLAPLVCVIPQQGILQLNVNTVTEQQAPVIAALIPNLPIEAALALISSRPEQGFSDINEFWASSQLSGLTIPDDVKTMFDVRSRYFQAELMVQFADSRFQLTSVFHVDDNQVIRVVARRFGGPG